MPDPGPRRMSADFPNIAILGGGLLGGSLAMALRPHQPQVRLWARRPETVAAALEAGIPGASGDLATAVAGADLLVLAVPVGSMAALVRQALDAGCPATCLVTDVGSVKRAPHQSIPPVLAGRGMEFIGSHPMAGSEQTGLGAASADLFRNAACLLTNDERVSQDRADALERFWQAVGCRTTWMDAAAHDQLVARISHLPHIVAAGAARICLSHPHEGRFGGGGLRDTTRVASGNAGMWAEILTENHEALLEPLRQTIADLGGLLHHLETGDRQAVCHWLAEAKERRDLLHTNC
jgi:prephenate dehydrogenase